MNPPNWEIIADQIVNAGWSYGYNKGIFARVGDRCVVHAVKDGHLRYVVHAETLNEGFGKLPHAIRQVDG